MLSSRSLSCCIIVSSLQQDSCRVVDQRLAGALYLANLTWSSPPQTSHTSVRLSTTCVLHGWLKKVQPADHVTTGLPSNLGRSPPPPPDRQSHRNLKVKACDVCQITCETKPPLIDFQSHATPFRASWFKMRVSLGTFFFTYELFSLS